MARVVQKRTSTPYLLIVFVFLFLVAASLAAMFGLRWDDARKKTAESTDLANKYITPGDARDPVFVEMLSQAGKPGGGTVYSQLRKHESELSRWIDAGSDTYAQASAAIQALKNKDEELRKLSPDLPRLDIYKGMTGVVAEGNQRIKDSYDQIQSLQKDKTDLETQKSELLTQIEDLKTAQTKQIADIKSQMQAEQGKVGDEHQAYQEKLTKAAQESDKRVEDLTKDLNDKQTLIDKVKRDLETATLENSNLKTELARYKGGSAPSPVAKADGKVQQILEADHLCYVDFGRSQGARVGLPLSVYPATGIPEDGAPKARLQITEVYDKSSQCSITQEDVRSPIVAGDLVANVAFDTRLKYKFVVEGVFDMNDSGEPSAAGAETVRDLITRSGGTVMDNITYETDFLVLGSAPKITERPAEGFSNPQEEKLFREQKKAYDRFLEVQRDAEKLHIPILNTNRFRNLIGYVSTAKTR